MPRKRLCDRLPMDEKYTLAYRIKMRNEKLRQRRKKAKGSKETEILLGIFKPTRKGTSSSLVIPETQSNFDTPLKVIYQGIFKNLPSEESESPIPKRRKVRKPKNTKPKTQSQKGFKRVKGEENMNMETVVISVDPHLVEIQDSFNTVHLAALEEQERGTTGDTILIEEFYVVDSDNISVSEVQQDYIIDPTISDNQLSPGGSLTTSNYLGTEISLAFMELENYIIRPAVKEDCLTIQLLIQELAEYEKMPEGPTLTIKDLERDGFGDRPFFEAFVAATKDSGQVVGFALYFFVYSTWQGKALFLEDIYVQPQHRKQGIGRSFFKHIAQTAVKENCQRINFQVLDWNKPSIDFYKSLGAVDLTNDEGWHCFRLWRPQIEQLAQMQ